MSNGFEAGRVRSLLFCHELTRRFIYLYAAFTLFFPVPNLFIPFSNFFCLLKCFKCSSNQNHLNHFKNFNQKTFSPFKFHMNNNKQIFKYFKMIINPLVLSLFCSYIAWFGHVRAIQCIGKYIFCVSLGLMPNISYV